MDKDDNKLCDKCGLLPQSPVQPKPPVCKRKKKCCKKDCCENEFAFRKVVIPAALGDDTTGKDKPENGAYTNSYVEYEANGAQYMYDSYGVYTKIEGGGGSEGTLDFNELENRPKYAGEEMTGETDIPNVNTAVAAEATLREAADTALSGDIAAESLARQNADSGLQTQIDAISASSDVTDIVGTYAELQNYDTSTLSNNDIVKVLQDEEHDNETTYYRWSTATQTFTLIGEEGPYYTKSAADAKFQDKLTAGANISIDQSTNTISATDTTYNDFTGTDGVNAGTAGLVPAPATTDAGKYLKADGTWDTVSGGIPTTATFWGASYNSVNNKVDGGLVLPSRTSASEDVSDNSHLLIGARSNNSSGTSIYRQSSQGGINYQASRYNTGGHRFTVGGSLSCVIDYQKLDMQSHPITSVTDPTLPQDAATKNYTDNLVISYASLNGAGAPTTATEGKYVGQLYYDTTNEDMYFLKAIDTTTTPSTYTWEAVGGGSSVNVVQTIGTSTTDVMSQAATTDMIYPSGSVRRVRIGDSAVASTNGSVAIGGEAAVNSGSLYGTAIGYQAKIWGSQSLALGMNSKVKGDYGVSVGAQTNNTSDTYGTHTTAVGYSAHSIATGSVALGAYSEANVAGQVNIGTRDTNYGYNSSNYRLLSGVYDPQSAHDAATKNYCDSLAVVTFPNSTFDAIIGEI